MVTDSAGGSVLEHLRNDRSGLDWWDTGTAGVIVEMAKAGGFVLALAGIVEVLREGWDPDWVVGGIGAPAAFTVAQEWLAAGVDPVEVADWYRSGCWDPKAARRMVGVGLHPVHLLTAERAPRHLVDIGPDGEIPLAAAVSDNYLTADQAVRVVTRGTL